jgi:hypothetical protein
MEVSAGTPLTALGECHRYAPRPVVVTEEALSEATVVWPVTQADDGCGEWFPGGDWPRQRGAAKPASMAPQSEPPKPGQLPKATP